MQYAALQPYDLFTAYTRSKAALNDINEFIMIVLPSDNPIHIKLEDIQREHYRSTQLVHYAAHTDWTKQGSLAVQCSLSKLIDCIHRLFIVECFKVNDHGILVILRAVRYLPNMDCFISCSTTWADAMVIGWLDGKGKNRTKLYDYSYFVN